MTHCSFKNVLFNLHEFECFLWFSLLFISNLPHYGEGWMPGYPHVPQRWQLAKERNALSLISIQAQNKDPDHPSVVVHQ
jgi:hypothetical protein